MCAALIIREQPVVRWGQDLAQDYARRKPTLMMSVLNRDSASDGITSTPLRFVIVAWWSWAPASAYAGPP